MPDREKVVNGLEWCMNEKHDCYREKGCPYENVGDVIGCKYALHRDAIALLKAQEPRLVAEPDFDGADEFGYIPVWTEEKNGDMYCECITKTAITDSDCIGVIRFWTSRPDEKRRAETPWE